MQFVRIIERAPIIGCKNDFDLEALNGVFKSPFHKFEDNESYMSILEYLEKLYKVEISEFYNPDLDLEFKDECN